MKKKKQQHYSFLLLLKGLILIRKIVYSVFVSLDTFLFKRYNILYTTQTWTTFWLIIDAIYIHVHALKCFNSFIYVYLKLRD